MPRCEGWYQRWATLGLSCALWLSMPTAQAMDWSWFNRSVKGSGQVTVTQRAISGFSAVSLELPGQLELVQDQTEGLSLETDDNLHALIETVVQGDELKIRAAKPQRNLDAKVLKITLHVRKLERIAVSGSGDVHSASLAVPRLKLAIAGSGDVRLDALETDSLNISLAGSGDVTAAGRANVLEASVAGSGDLRLARLATKNVKLRIAGSGDATVWATDTLASSVAGSGDVRYYGGPMVTSSVAGSGSVTRLGAAP